MAHRFSKQELTNHLWYLIESMAEHHGIDSRMGTAQVSETDPKYSTKRDAIVRIQELETVIDLVKNWDIESAMIRIHYKLAMDKKGSN